MVWDSGFGVRDLCLNFFWGGCRLFGEGYRVWGVGVECRVQGSGLRVQGSEFRVQGPGLGDYAWVCESFN